MIIIISCYHEVILFFFCRPFSFTRVSPFCLEEPTCCCCLRTKRKWRKEEISIGSKEVIRTGRQLRCQSYRDDRRRKVNGTCCGSLCAIYETGSPPARNGKPMEFIWHRVDGWGTFQTLRADLFCFSSTTDCRSTDRLAGLPSSDNTETLRRRRGLHFCPAAFLLLLFRR